MLSCENTCSVRVHICAFAGNRRELACPHPRIVMKGNDEKQHAQQVFSDSTDTSKMKGIRANFNILFLPFFTFCPALV